MSEPKNSLPHRFSLFSVALVASVFPAWLGCGEQGPPVVQLPTPEVTVMQPLTLQVTDDFEDTGRTAAVEDVEIRSRVSGYLVKRHVPDGAEVKKDQVLFTIDPEPYQAALDRTLADVDRWKATLEKATADLARTRQLVPTGAASKEELDLNIAQVKLNEAEVKGAEADVKRAQLDLTWTEIKAPFDGRISKCNFSEGDLIPLGSEGEATTLTTIVSTQSMWVYFNVPERTLLEYQRQVRKEGKDSRPDHVKDVKAPFYIGLAVEEGYPRAGLIDFVDNRVDLQTGTIQLRGVVDNADRSLAAGLFVRVRLPMSDPRPSLLVPETAIATDQGQKYLLAVGEGDVVQRLPVVLGRQIRPEGFGEYFRVILSGLEPGKSVIVNGIQRARTGAKVAPKPAEPAAQGQVKPEPAAAAPTPPATQGQAK
ncbi:MAG: efflux RND transporter periplasmic adaptor subunit [Thermoguttaceae bacterium]